MSTADNLFERAGECLFACEPEAKLELTRAAAADWQSGRLELGPAPDPEPPERVGRPARPELVHPRKLARRGFASEEGRAALLHAVAHIEFNAINLAWDAVYRFRDLPRDYYSDWVQVALEESRHFGLLKGRLADLDRAYGDFPAHNGLWYMAQRTAQDPLARMAMVPRVLEARGLDVTPAMIGRFRQAGDLASVAVLEVILAEEEGHVEAGSRWFRYLCRARGQDPEASYFALIDEYLNGEVRCPLHREARLRAGFTESELSRLEELCKPS